MLGRSVGRFRIVGKLGEGGMGSVWKAEDTLLGRTVALKFLPESLTGSERARERFLREARSTSALAHPGIATLYEAGEEAGELYLAVEFVDGETVSDRVARGPLDVREALRLAAEVADALGHAHERGVIHRDVTARNVMIARDGRAMVIDFGLALRDHTARITTTGAAFGTIPYMAPEVVRGGGATARSDLYGLGVVLYEMLTGRRPFDQARGAAALHATTHRRPDPPSAHREGIGPAVDQLVRRLLARDPDRRPASAAALAVELRAAALGAVGPPSPAVSSRAQGAPLPGSSSRRSVAVFPFGSLDSSSSSDASGHAQRDADNALADGLAEVLSASLSRVPQLRIVPPAVVRGARAFAHDPQSAAQELGAALLVQGTVRRSGERMRVTVSLLDVRRGTQLAGETVDGSADDLFALEDALVVAVGRALKIEIGRRPRGATDRSPGSDANHEAYVRALGYLQRTDQQPMIESAVRLLENLRSREGDTAVVHAALGRGYLVLYELTFETAMLHRAETSCRAAMALDPHSPDVLVTLGRLEYRLGQYDASIASLQRSLELRPHNPDALLSLARTFEAGRRFDEAIVAAREVVALRPEHWMGYNRVAMVHFLRGEFELAIPPWRRVVELTPDNGVVLSNLGAAQFQIGRLDEALDCYTRALAIAPTASACSGAGTVLFFLGRAAEAVAMLTRAVALSPRDARAWGNLGDAQRWAPGLETDSRVSFDRAIDLAREQTRLNPSDAVNHARLALWLSKRGRTPESLEAIRHAFELRPDDAGVIGRAVTVHLLAGDERCARECLALALEKGYSWIELQRDPELEPLRRDPETRELLVRVETARLAALARGAGTGEET